MIIEMIIKSDENKYYVSKDLWVEDKKKARYMSQEEAKIVKQKLEQTNPEKKYTLELGG